MIYDYTGKTTSPDLDKIEADIIASNIIDKAYFQYLRWDQDDATLKCYFSTELSESDKAKLDILIP